MKGLVLPLLLMLVAPDVWAALPGDSAAGKRLHEAKCTGCHDASVYTRKDRRVASLDALAKQLDNCAHAAKGTFSTSDRQNLLKYLNEEFYKFR